jgi:CIC family chloride channel protein
VISRWLQPVAIFDVLTRQDGLDLPSMEEQREEGILRVEDAMQPVTETVLDANETLERAFQRLDERSPDVFLVRLNPTGWSSVGKKELDTMIKEGKGELMLSSLLADRRISFLHPDHPLEMALRQVDRWPIVPVVNRADLRKLEGVVSQRDVLDSYRDFGEA